MGSDFRKYLFKETNIIYMVLNGERFEIEHKAMDWKTVVDAELEARANADKYNEEDPQKAQNLYTQELAVALTKRVLIRVHNIIVNDDFWKKAGADIVGQIGATLMNHAMLSDVMSKNSNSSKRTPADGSTNPASAPSPTSTIPSSVKSLSSSP
jgi:hypothetical protein